MIQEQDYDQAAISFEGGYFHLRTDGSSYIMHILESGHPAMLYYGRRIGPRTEYSSLYQRFPFIPGTETSYSREFPDINLETALLEFPGSGKGDYRIPALELVHPDGSRVCDFVYESHRIVEGSLPAAPGLPGTRSTDNSSGDNSSGDAATDLRDASLILTLRDREIRAELIYRVLPDRDVITRSVRLINDGPPVKIERIMSANLDLMPGEYTRWNLGGKWIAEKQLRSAPVSPGLSSLVSRRLSSGAEHNPVLAVSAGGSRTGTPASGAGSRGSGSPAGEDSGDCWGFALLYSGNHEVNVEKSPHDMLRIQLGIGSQDFSWQLDTGETFSTPELAMTFSHRGYGAMSRKFHDYFNLRIVPPRWRGRPRPLLFNSWEALYFDVNESKVMNLVKAGRKLGMELFVLDDGWFEGRNDDHSSLGDWTVDKKKFPRGLADLADKVRAQGLEFGIWVEPEMVSPVSRLFTDHPNWAVGIPGRETSLGRHQLILDLTNPAVVDHLEASMNRLFEECRPAYVKWDMNRCGSDLYSPALAPERQGEFAHRYILGLYDLLSRLTSAWPDILFESCASGGNRFDGGMLYYTPQIWTSDNTDPGARMKIQHGSSWFFPLSSTGAHVGSDPSHQILRNNSIEHRFHCAAFGSLGYELNLAKLSPFDQKVIAGQVEIYKQYREVFQFGSHYRLASPFEENHAVWQVMAADGTRGILGCFQLLKEPGAVFENIRLTALEPSALYRVETLPHFINIARFGELINDYVPFEVKSSGLAGLAHKIISDNYLFPGEIRKVEAPGDELMYAGFRPHSQFNGAGYGEGVRIMGDFGSRLYLITRLS